MRTTTLASSRVACDELNAGLEGGRRRFRNRKKGLYGSSPHHMRKNAMEALRRVGSLEVLRGAGGGFGTGRKDCTAVVPQQPTP